MKMFGGGLGNWDGIVYFWGLIECFNGPTREYRVTVITLLVCYIYYANLSVLNSIIELRHIAIYITRT